MSAHSHYSPLIGVAGQPTPDSPLTCSDLYEESAGCRVVLDLDYPAGSFRAKFLFRLKTRFYSGRDRAGREKKARENKDTTPNNHLCRDWISGIPIAKAGGWKRLFRRLCEDNGCPKKVLDRLFGVIDNETQPKDLCGELQFHHTQFFTQQNNSRTPVAKTATYLIAPRDPATGKVQKVIITYEVVPPKSLCELVVDYLPRHGKPGQGQEVWQLLKKVAGMVEEDAIGGKSTVFGQLELVACESTPEFPKSGGAPNNG